MLVEIHHLDDDGPSRRNPNLTPTLRPSNSTAFKRENRRQRKERKRQQKTLLLLETLTLQSTPPTPSLPPTFSDLEWPCNPSPPTPQTIGWGAPWGSTSTPTPSPFVAEPAKISPAQAQKNAIAACRAFLSKTDGEDDDEEGGDDDALEFFMGMFEKDGDLRGLYVENWEKGEFCCLVCGGMGEKVGKRFAGAVGLTQHCSAISKTKSRGAHRAFGRAVGKVLGWNGDKPPSGGTGVMESVGKVYIRAQDLWEDTQKEDTITAKGAGGPVETDNRDLMDM